MSRCRFQLDAVWKIILPFLEWCLWRERDGPHEKTLVELKALVGGFFLGFVICFLPMGLQVGFECL